MVRRRARYNAAATGDRMRGIILGTAFGAAFGITLVSAGSASPSRDRACHSLSADMALRLLRDSALQVMRRGGERVFVSAPIKPALTVGIAF
jgi:hypothetical protein